MYTWRTWKVHGLVIQMKFHTTVVTFPQPRPFLGSFLKMADVTKVFGLIRVVILALVTFFAVLVLIMGALVTNYTVTFFGGYDTYAAFAIAIAVLTLFTVPVMIALSISRKGAFPSMIVVELSCVGVLWILWLAVGGTIGELLGVGYCVTYYSSVVQPACMETLAMAAFSFLNWILLMVLDIFLLSLAILQASRGNSAIWTSCVTDVDYGAPGSTFATAGAKDTYGSPALPATLAQYPQQQYLQQTYTPQQVYSPQRQQTYPPQQLYSPQLQQTYPPQQVYTLQQQQHGMPMISQV